MATDEGKQSEAWKRFREVNKGVAENYAISEAYVVRNYDLLSKVYGKDEYLALRGDVILGHSSKGTELAQKILTSFPEGPVLIRRLEEFVNPKIHEIESPEIAE